MTTGCELCAAAVVTKRYFEDETCWIGDCGRAAAEAPDIPVAVPVASATAPTSVTRSFVITVPPTVRCPCRTTVLTGTG